MERLLYLLAIIGAFAVAFQFFDILVKYIPYLHKLRAATWDIAADKIKLRGLRKKAIASNIENTLNLIVHELKDEFPKGWISRASIQWVGKSLPVDFKDNQLVIKIRPTDDQDFNYLNAIYYFFSSSIFPKTHEVVPLSIKEAASLYLVKRTIHDKQSYLKDNFEKHFLSKVASTEQSVAGYYGDYNRIDEFGFFGSAFIREVDTLASSLRFSHERERIELEIRNILTHLMKFEKLNKKVNRQSLMQEEEWYKTLSATSYGFLLVARPEDMRVSGMEPYIKRAKQRLNLGIKRLYVIGCSAEQQFVKDVIGALMDIKEYKLEETFKLYKDYRGQGNGIAALFIVDTERERFRKNIDNQTEIEIEDDEDEIAISETPKVVTKSGVIAKVEELTKIIKTAINDIPQNDGWVYLGNLGEKIKETLPLFNPHHYGSESLRKLLLKMSDFEVKLVKIDTQGAKNTSAYVRIKSGAITNHLPHLVSNLSGTNKFLEDIRNPLSDIVAQLSKEKGWAYLGTVGKEIKNKIPNFEPKKYGSSTLRNLLEDLKIFEIKKEGTSFLASIYVRLKSANEIITSQENLNESIILTRQQLFKALVEVINSLKKDDGWAYLGNVGISMKKKYSSFDHHQYGVGSLRQLIETFPEFQVKEEGAGSAKSIYVKVKTVR